MYQAGAFRFYGKNGRMMSDPNDFTRDAWEANAEIWDSRMGDDGNDFFNISARPKQRCHQFDFDSFCVYSPFSSC